jgi:hypothetical protein
MNCRQWVVDTVLYGRSPHAERQVFKQQVSGTWSQENRS